MSDRKVAEDGEVGREGLARKGGGNLVVHRTIDRRVPKTDRYWYFIEARVSRPWYRQCIRGLLSISPNRTFPPRARLTSHSLSSLRSKNHILVFPVQPTSLEPTSVSVLPPAVQSAMNSLPGIFSIVAVPDSPRITRSTSKTQYMDYSWKEESPYVLLSIWFKMPTEFHVIPYRFL